MKFVISDEIVNQTEKLMETIEKTNDPNLNKIRISVSYYLPIKQVRASAAVLTKNKAHATAHYYWDELPALNAAKATPGVDQKIVKDVEQQLKSLYDNLDKWFEKEIKARS